MSQPATSPDRQRGSSLIEVLVGLAILASALVFVFSAMSSFVMVNGNNQARTSAAVAARTRMEQLRFVDPATLPDTGSQATPAVVGDYRFSVITEYCSTSAYCDDTTRHVVVRIENDGQRIFETETVFTQLR